MKIKVLVASPGKAARVREIENTLDSFQKIVDGYIECIYPWKDIIIVCNEEGWIRGLKPNRYIRGQLIVGTFIIVGDNHNGDFRSLTEDEITEYKMMFSTRSLI